MKTVTMLDFRRNAERIIAEVKMGQQIILTYRGEPVLRLEPLLQNRVAEDDPFYSLDRLADEQGESLDNRDMDKLIYGE